MYSKKERAGAKRRSLIGWLLAERIRERVCQSCGVPYVEHPDREPFKRFKSRNVELMVFDDHTLGKKKFLWTVGSWRLSKKGFHLTQLMDQTELSDLLNVSLKALEYFKVNNKVVSFSDNELEMSPSLSNKNKKTNGGLWK
ncbi:MAG: hypothetical protein J0M26_06365 [Planctomycetes bacterium]|nr:hypothetical protein [Planctomycetota bacterium]